MDTVNYLARTRKEYGKFCLLFLSAQKSSDLEIYNQLNDIIGAGVVCNLTGLKKKQSIIELISLH